MTPAQAGTAARPRPQPFADRGVMPASRPKAAWEMDAPAGRCLWHLRRGKFAFPGRLGELKKWPVSADFVQFGASRASVRQGD